MQRKYSPNMICRFIGAKGKQKLVDVLCEQDLVAGNLQIAKELARSSNIRELKPKVELMLQDGTDNDIYFILSGSVAIIINGREIASRKSGEHVGEMALIDTTARRSATVRVLEPTIVAQIIEPKFTQVANKYPDLWRRTAVAIGRRLKERNKFHTVPRNEPAIFIGSSSEGCLIAESIYKSLSKFAYVPQIWSKGIFECSKTTIEELIRMTKEMDFAVIVFSPDDLTQSRGKKKKAPRDNVVFELGLFMGALSRERTYIVAPKQMDIKIPSDLLGVTCLNYQRGQGHVGLAKRLRPVIQELCKLINKYGPI